MNIATTRACLAVWLSLTCAALLSPRALAQAENVYLNLPTAELAEVWLQRTCGVDDEPLVRLAIAARAAELAPVFRRAVVSGPGADDIARIEEAAARRFEARESVLRDAPELTGLAAEALEGARAQTREDFVERSRDSYVVGYRTQALIGVRIADPQGSRGMLEELAKDSDSPLQGTARTLLRGAP